MKYKDCLIAYTPAWDESSQTKGQIKVGYCPDEDGWSDAYSYTTGGVFTNRQKMDHWQQVSMMFADFHAAVVRDGVDPQDVHKAFLAIDEYRKVISPDIKGAEE